MDITSIRLLKGLANGDARLADLPGLLKIKKRRLAYVVRGLADQDYVEKSGTAVRLKKTPKTTLFRDILKITDVERLLAGSNEVVFSQLAGPSTIPELTGKTGLSKATVYRAVSDLQSIGAITRSGDHIKANGSHESLVMFAKLLCIEREERYEDGGAEIIYNGNSTILRKTQLGKITRGATTGFTLFADYGVDYRPIYDYFCEQETDMDLQDVLLHAVYSSVHSKNKLELLMSIVFYTKHKDKMDVLKLRQKSSMLGISQIWLDIESYVRRKQVVNTDMFLPWDEFVAKAELYEVPSENYTYPNPNETLFEEINDQLSRPVTAYLLGGENMRIKSLKASTKDCDIVVEHRDNFENLSEALVKLGYNKIIKTEYADEDMRIMPTDIFMHKNKSRIDLFTSTIMGDLVLTSGMRERSDMLDYGMLKIGLLRNEDVFILKAAACREGDIHDMASLVAGNDRPETGGSEHAPFDWDLVWDEILRQEAIDDTRGFTATIFAQISYLTERTGIISPFSDRLRIRVVDQMIRRVLLGESMLVKEVVDLLNGADITEQMIRNRIDSLEKNTVIKKHQVGRMTRIQLLQNNKFPKPEQKINRHRLKRYLDWRFHMRKKPSEQSIQELAADLKKFGFDTIGKLDEMIMHATEVLRQYELEQFSKRYFNEVGAARICTGVCHGAFGKSPRSVFFISEFDKYHGLLEKEFILPEVIKK